MFTFNRYAFQQYNQKNLTDWALACLNEYVHEGENLVGLSKLYLNGALTPEVFQQTVNALHDKVHGFVLKSDEAVETYYARNDVDLWAIDYKKTPHYRSDLQISIDNCNKELRRIGYLDGTIAEAERVYATTLLDSIDDYQKQINQSIASELQDGYKTNILERLNTEPPQYYPRRGQAVPIEFLPIIELTHDDVSLMIFAILFYLKREQVDVENYPVELDAYAGNLNQKLAAIDSVVELGTDESWEYFEPNDGMLQLFALDELETLLGTTEKIYE